jgi:hypothetical protein
MSTCLGGLDSKHLVQAEPCGGLVLHRCDWCLEVAHMARTVLRVQILDKGNMKIGVGRMTLLQG